MSLRPFNPEKDRSVFADKRLFKFMGDRFERVTKFQEFLEAFRTPDLFFVFDLGGPGSGHYGHKGTKGRRGGSAPGTSAIGVARRAEKIKVVKSGGRSQLTQKDFKTDKEDTTLLLVEGASRRLASKWEVDRADLDALAKEEGRKLLLDDTEAKYEMAYAYIRKWLGSSGGPVPTAMAVHINDKLGSRYKLTKRDQNTTRFIKEHPAQYRAVTSLADAMYSETQGWLKEKGVSNIRLSRSGAPAKDKPFSSWSLGWGGVRHEPGRNVITEVVLSKYILSVPPTGFGTLAESEVVVLARP